MQILMTRIYVGHGDMDLCSGTLLCQLKHKYATGRIQSFPKLALEV